MSALSTSSVALAAMLGVLSACGRLEFDHRTTDAAPVSPGAKLALGANHTCVLSGNGRVTCWGFNNHGQVGNGTRFPIGAPTQTQREPVEALAGDVERLAAGAHHNCATRVDGTVACWGYDEFGAVGDGGLAADQPSPVVISLANIVELSAGANHSCARSAEHLWCWGYSFDGQAGIDGDQLAPYQLATDASTITALGLGKWHSCAVRGGAIDCWGDNNHGELGDNTTVDRSVPLPVVGIDDAVEVTGGQYYTCARHADGAVSCFGQGTLGKLGNDDVVNDQLTPVRVVGLADAVALAGGDDFCCARRASGRVACWGDNSSGQLGAGLADPYRATPQEVAGLEGVVDLVAGHAHACAVTSEPALWCWGANGHTQLGDGTQTDRRMPVRLTVLELP